MGRLSQFQPAPEGQRNNQTQEQQLREKYETYKNMNQSQLQSSLFQEVARQKASGTFDFNALSNMVESMRGSLSENEYNNIKRILESLR